MALPVVAVERSIPADPHTIFQVLTDPAMHPVIDGSGSVREIRSTDARLRLQDAGQRAAIDRVVAADGNYHRIGSQVLRDDHAQQVAPEEARSS